jgi:hypothetical protein
MIGQQVALSLLVPRAIVVLESDPMAEGDLYPGDLLDVVLRIDRQYWLENRAQWGKVSRVARAVDTARDGR